jgi:hypothetical protein
LACTCNRSLASGIYPSWLKFSILNPIFQEGNKNLCLIIDQYHSYPHLVEFLKKEYVLYFTNIPYSVMFYQNTNTVLG